MWHDARKSGREKSARNFSSGTTSSDSDSTASRSCAHSLRRPILCPCPLARLLLEPGLSTEPPNAPRHVPRLPLPRSVSAFEPLTSDDRRSHYRGPQWARQRVAAPRPTLPGPGGTTLAACTSRRTIDSAFGGCWRSHRTGVRFPVGFCSKAESIRALHGTRLLCITVPWSCLTGPLVCFFPHAANICHALISRCIAKLDRHVQHRH